MAAEGEQVDVGGCVGKIIQITEDRVYVKGVYHYTDGYKESWRCVYDLKLFETAPLHENGVWDASELDGEWC